MSKLTGLVWWAEEKVTGTVWYNESCNRNNVDALQDGRKDGVLGRSRSQGTV